MRRHSFTGHRDAVPEDVADIIRWARNLLFDIKKDPDHLGMEPYDVTDIEVQYLQAKAHLEVYGPEPPPEPHPLDGFTIHWDGVKRFLEIICDFQGIVLDERGCFKGDEPLRKMKAATMDKRLGVKWMAHVKTCIEKTAARYNMPEEWVEKKFLEMFRPKSPEDRDTEMQQYTMTISYDFSR